VTINQIKALYDKCYTRDDFFTVKPDFRKPGDRHRLSGKLRHRVITKTDHILTISIAAPFYTFKALLALMIKTEHKDKKIQF